MSTTLSEGLRTAIELLKKFGDSGESVRRNATKIEDPVERLAYFRTAIRFMRPYAQRPTNLVRIPVDPRTFFEAEDLCDYARFIYPAVMAELVKMNSGQFNEAVLTGGIGSAKSSIAVYALVYQTYLLSCFRNPHAEFGLDPNHEIVIIFQSLSGPLSKDGCFTRYRQMVENAPYFARCFQMRKDYASECRFPRRVIAKPLSGSAQAAIGQNVIGGMIDEINFFPVVQHSKMAVDGGTYDAAVEVYNAIARRRRSRFTNQGKLPGLLIVASSRQRPGEFTEQKEREARTDPTIFVYDKRVWDIAPPGRFSGEMFPVFVGDAFRKPRLIEPDETIEPEDARLVIRVPVEYRKDFENDLHRALRDIAGVATQAIHPFILDVEKITKSFGQVKSVVSQPTVDFVATSLKVFPTRFWRPDEPRFAHVDLSATGDSTGVAIGCVEGFTEIKRGDGWSEILPVLRADMLLEVRPPRNGEIEYSKIRQLFYTLRQLGLNIRWITFDTYNSRDSIQILRQQGFATGVTSMDTDLMPFDVTKSAILDGRLKLPEHERCRMELVRLEFDPRTAKVDHPADGSKDVADALAGVVYGLTMRREIWVRHKIPPVRVPRSLTEKMGKIERSNFAMGRARESVEQGRAARETEVA